MSTLPGEMSPCWCRWWSSVLLAIWKQGHCLWITHNHNEILQMRERCNCFDIIKFAPIIDWEQCGGQRIAKKHVIAFSTHSTTRCYICSALIWGRLFFFFFLAFTTLHTHTHTVLIAPKKTEPWKLNLTRSTPFVISTMCHLQVHPVSPITGCGAAKNSCRTWL